MPSAVDRAATLAAQIAAVISSDVDIDYDVGSRASMMQTQVPDGTDARVWGHIRCRLISLPPQDTFGSLRAADGNIQLWATVRESPNGNQPG